MPIDSKASHDVSIHSEEDDSMDLVLGTSLRSRILIVDDEPFNLIPFKSALKNLQVTYCCANSGQEALKKSQ